MTVTRASVTSLVSSSVTPCGASVILLLWRSILMPFIVNWAFSAPTNCSNLPLPVLLSYASRSFSLLSPSTEMDILLSVPSAAVRTKRYSSSFTFTTLAEIPLSASLIALLISSREVWLLLSLISSGSLRPGCSILIVRVSAEVSPRASLVDFISAVVLNDCAFASCVTLIV